MLYPSVFSTAQIGVSRMENVSSSIAGTIPRKADSRLSGRSNRSDLSRMLQPWQKVVPSLHGSRVMQCKQKGNACYMFYPSSTSELATTRLVTTDVNSISFRFHPQISFCASFQSSKSSAIHAFARLGYRFGVSIDRRVIDGYMVDIEW